MSCVGLGIGLEFLQQSEQYSVTEHAASPSHRFVTGLLAVAIAQGSEFFQFSPQLPLFLFYLLVAGKFAVVIFLIVVAGFFTGANNHSSIKSQ